jgi:CBS domain-containing protein
MDTRRERGSKLPESVSLRRLPGIWQVAPDVAGHKEGTMKLGEIMTADPRAARPTDAVHQVAEMMRDEDVGSIPIVEGDRLLGIITDRDIAIKVVAAGIDPRRATVREYMTSDPVTGSPQMSDRDALALMGREQIRRLPVVQQGRLVGIVALGDLALEADADGEEEEVGSALEEISAPTSTTR